MEAYESFVALALEAEGFVVSGAVRFPVRRQVRKASRTEVQQHGYEVDLLGARADRLVLATVKSFFGSRGVVAEDVTGAAPDARRVKRYHLLNDVEIRDAVMNQAANRYGYSLQQVELRLYVGRFAAPATGANEAAVRKWAQATHAGAGPIRVFNVDDVVRDVRRAATSKEYRDDPALVTIKVLEAAGALVPMAE